MRTLRLTIILALCATLACDQNKQDDKPQAESPNTEQTKPEASKPPAQKEEVKKEEEKTPEEPIKPLTSKDFTEITPDTAETAKSPPKAEDLARYTADLKGDGPLKAKIETTMGVFDCELYEKQTPITVANFVGLSRGLKAWTSPQNGMAQVGIPLYQNVVFHRVIPGFMIQGGDPLGKGIGNPGYAIDDEFDKSLRHDKGGLLSMANAGPKTGGSQFFVTEVATPHLNDRHSIFGACDNVALVKEISAVPRAAMDRPVKDVKIKKITIYRGEKG